MVGRLSMLSLWILSAFFSPHSWTAVESTKCLMGLGFGGSQGSHVRGTVTGYRPEVSGKRERKFSGVALPLSGKHTRELVRAGFPDRVWRPR
jgi:hypothetical protein